MDACADYRLRGDGTVEVLNSCPRDGRVDTAKGRAWVGDKAAGAKLKVSFFWPFRGDYWIIDLGADYDYAVVSAPSMKYPWILSRTPQMDERRYREIVGGLRDRGFDVAKLSRPTASPEDRPSSAAVPGVRTRRTACSRAPPAGPRAKGLCQARHACSRTRSGSRARRRPGRGGTPG